MPSDSRKNGDRKNSRGRESGGGRARASWREGLPSNEPPADSPIRPDRGSSYHEPESEIGHRWRDMQRQTSQEQSLPPLPDQENRRSNKSGSSRTGSTAIIIGAILLLIVVGMLVLPFSPLVGDDEDDPTPTAELAQETVVATELPAGNETAVPTNVPAETVESDFLVCIDPGHGGWDYGRERMDMATFGPPWVHESEITLSMSFFLRDELESRGIAVVMTRETGGAVNWQNEDINGDGQVMTDNSDQSRIHGFRDEAQARINICNEAGADIMISVHLNGFDDQSVGGYQIYYNSAFDADRNQRNQDLATFLYREMPAAFEEQGYDASPRGSTDDKDLSAETHEFGSEQYPLMIGPRVVKPEYTIEPTNMPGVIIETLFITNTDDVNFIMNPANQKRLAVSWADGIENYRNQYGD